MSKKKPYICVTSGMSGYFAVMISTDEEGFEEPYQTGVGRYKSFEEAENEAKMWAKDEGLEYH